MTTHTSGMRRAPDHYTSDECARHATFNAATKYLTPWQIAHALNKLRPGLDWRGCTKGHMRDEWARGDLKQFNGQQLCAAIIKAQS